VNMGITLGGGKGRGGRKVIFPTSDRFNSGGGGGVECILFQGDAGEGGPFRPLKGNCPYS